MKAMARLTYLYRMRLYSLLIRLKYYGKIFHLPSKSIRNDAFIVSMVDGHFLTTCGLADKLRGAISAYKFCETNQLKYKLLFTDPFDLQDYLLPNKYDWFVDVADVHYNFSKAKPLVIMHSIKEVGVRNNYMKILDKMRCQAKDIHLYTNAPFYNDNEEAARIFNLLFKPTDRLLESINSCFSTIDDRKGYCSATFRFQQLLGDFKEGKFNVLPECEREIYIIKCLDIVKQIHNKENCTILVTSDSITFLDRAKELDFVYVIPDKVKHPAFEKEKQTDYTKSFVDMYMISKAKKVYRVCGGEMYMTGFPYFAAGITNAPFYDIKFELQ